MIYLVRVDRYESVRILGMFDTLEKAIEQLQYYYAPDAYEGIHNRWMRGHYGKYDYESIIDDFALISKDNPNRPETSISSVVQFSWYIKVMKNFKETLRKVKLDSLLYDEKQIK